MNRKLLLVVLGSKLAQNHKVGAWIWTSIIATYHIHVLISLGKSEVLSLPSIISVLQLKLREEVQAAQASFSDPSDTDAARSQNLKQQNNMFKDQPASLEFFQNTTVCRLQKPPHTSISHKSFYETSYEAIKMIYGPFLILVYWTLLSSNIKVNNFPRLTQHRCQNIQCFFTLLEIEK